MHNVYKKGTIYDLSTSTLYVEINDLQTNSFRIVGLSEIFLKGKLNSKTYCMYEHSVQVLLIKAM
jgi:hypothetical protein